MKNKKTDRLPVFRNRFALELRRGLKAFLNLEAGLTRGAVPQAFERVSGGPDRRAQNVIWVFGWIRTGSTWLGSMMGDLEGCRLWNEPRVGELFGTYYYETAAHRRENRNFILSDEYREVWIRGLRNLILDSAEARYPALARDGKHVIKEPSGSIGAPLLMEALPESRMVFLIRDPRDVISSALDAAREGSWVGELQGVQRRKQQKGKTGLRQDNALANERAARQRAKRYARFVGNSRQAYESHRGPKSLVRYEDLLSDTLATMRRLCKDLSIEVDEKELRGVVERHSWENIPAEQKGEGKFYRKASPGSFSEDLTQAQISAIEEETAPLLREFYPEGR